MNPQHPDARSDALLERIAEATAPLTGAAFFRALVENCARAFAFREVFVTECIAPRPTRVRMVCHWLAGDFAENVEYELAGTPCARTIGEGRTTFIGDALETLYPNWPGEIAYLGVPVFEADGATVAGHIAFYDDRPREDIAALPVFRILAARAGAELLRMRAEERARRHLATAAHAARRAAMHDMASAIAHEINQPLTSMLAYAQACARLLRSGEATPAETQQCLERIAMQAERAAAIVHRLRYFVRHEDAPPADLRVDALVTEVVALMQPQAIGADVAIVTEIPPDLPTVRGDAIQLQQVLVNLVRNGIDAVAEAGAPRREVRVTAIVPEQGGVEILVEDTGPGLDAAARARLFEPFFTTKVDGMGIGLSVSRSIVEAHGGTLEAETRPAGGARFRVALPAGAVTKPAPRAN